MLRDTDNELVSHFFGAAAVARDRRGLRPTQASRLHAAPVQWGGRRLSLQWRVFFGKILSSNQQSDDKMTPHTRVRLLCLYACI